jgi:NAD(P)-dependent dehydrogenase (short-subunit alcohol dehydrogenase family)
VEVTKVKELAGKVAVITGAASGIGRALAERAAREGMKVVLADIEEDALRQAAEELTATGADVLAVRTDVSRAEDVEALAQRTLEAYGAVHLLCNNAGVSAVPTPVWENTLNDWAWTLGVNLWGVIHGVHTFLPIMLTEDADCHVVNTASIAGLGRGGYIVPYNVSKHGVVVLSEALHLQLAERQARVKVSVLCPGFVRTRICYGARNRPEALRNPGAETESIPQGLRDAVESGIPPSQVADIVFEAIREERFYILTDPGVKAAVRKRMEDILEDRNPQ